MDTRIVRFYHGTSATAAASILVDGARNQLAQLRVRDCVRALWPVILEAAGSFNATAKLFVQAGSEYYASAPLALQNIYHENTKSTFSYGEFYVTLGLEKASGYATRGRCGSELLLFTEEALKVIRMLEQNNEYSEEISDTFPELLEHLKQPVHPVVLELTGIEEHRLSDEGGGPPSISLIELFLEFQHDSSLIVDASFQVTGVTSIDINAVYDLKSAKRDGAGTLDLTGLSNVRMEPSDWLSGED